jgi:choline dehydrogenase-like flavoprotein
MRIVNIEQAAATRWDCIVVGSSFSAMFFAYGLRRHRKPSVLVVERGLFASHADQVQDLDTRPYETFSQANHSEMPKRWVASKLFGGNSNCWAACIPRFHPNDFRTGTLYGVDTDWPITYDTIETHYGQVEEIMEAAGGGSDRILPRSRPFPLPAHAPSAADVVLREHDLEHWFAQPAARGNGGRAPQCCANGICSLCPIDSKFTILNGLEVFDGAQMSYLLGHEARQVVIAAGQAHGVLVRDKSRREAELKSDVVGLAANAISNVAILFRSGVENRHLGRGLNEQVSKIATYSIPFPNYFGGTIVTGHGYQLYDGGFRKDRAGVLIEVRNDLEIASRGRGKWLNNLRLKFIAGERLDPANRVVLIDDEPHIEWKGHSRYALSALDSAVERSKSLLPFDHEIVNVTKVSSTESHIQGMTPMADTPAEGVVDQFCQVFGVPNLYALGAGVFPTCSPANPTLTLSAIALRAGESI